MKAFDTATQSEPLMRISEKTRAAWNGHTENKTRMWIWDHLTRCFALHCTYILSQAMTPSWTFEKNTQQKLLRGRENWKRLTTSKCDEAHLWTIPSKLCICRPFPFCFLLHLNEILPKILLLWPKYTLSSWYCVWNAHCTQKTQFTYWGINNWNLTTLEVDPRKRIYQNFDSKTPNLW